MSRNPIFDLWEIALRMYPDHEFDAERWQEAAHWLEQPAEVEDSETGPALARETPID